MVGFNKDGARKKFNFKYPTHTVSIVIYVFNTNFPRKVTRYMNTNIFVNRY